MLSNSNKTIWQTLRNIAATVMSFRWQINRLNDFLLLYLQHCETVNTELLQMTKKCHFHLIRHWCLIQIILQKTNLTGLKIQDKAPSPKTLTIYHTNCL